MDLDDFDWLDNVTNPSNLAELEEIANSLSKEASKLEVVDYFYLIFLINFKLNTITLNHWGYYSLHNLFL